MLSGKEIIDQLLDYLELTPGAFANKIGLARPEWLSRLEQEFGFILHDMDLKREVWKLKQELEEIKKMLPFINCSF